MFRTTSIFLGFFDPYFGKAFVASKSFLLLLAAIVTLSASPTFGAILYSQDFESLNDGDAVSSLPGWADVVPTTRVKNTAEIGKAIDPRGQSAATFGGPDMDALGVAPSAGDGVWTFGFDATVFATTGNTFEMNIFNTGFSSRFAVLKNTDNNNWSYQIYNDGGGSDVTGNVNDGGGAGTHTTTIEFVVDVDNDQAFFRIGGTESTKADAYPVGGPTEYRLMELYLPMPSSGMLLDNFRVTNSVVPEPGAGLLMILGGIVMASCARMRKRS